VAPPFELPMRPADFLEEWFQGSWLEPQYRGVFHTYYQSYFKHFGPYIREQYNNRLADIVELISLREERTEVLDIGSGCGTESLYFSLLGCKVLGVELSTERFEVACERKRILEAVSQKSLPCEFIRSSIFDAAIRKKFDFIWMEEAFHHVEPRNELVGLLASFLKPGGYVVVSEANALNLAIQLALFKKRKLRTLRVYVDNEGIERLYGNERILRASTMKKLFQREGISCVRVRHFRIFPNLAINDGLLKAFDRLFPKFLKLFFIHYNYVGRK